MRQIRDDRGDSYFAQDARNIRDQEGRNDHENRRIEGRYPEHLEGGRFRDRADHIAIHGKGTGRLVHVLGRPVEDCARELIAAYDLLL